MRSTRERASRSSPDGAARTSAVGSGRGGLGWDVGPQEAQDALERIPSILATLPAMGLVVVPLDLVGLALDLERLDHPLGHERHHPLVLASMEEQQRRLDALGAMDGRAPPIALGTLGRIGVPHHLLEIESPRPVPAPEA